MRTSIFFISMVYALSSWSAEQLRISAGAAVSGIVFKKIKTPFEEKSGISLVYPDTASIYDGLKKVAEGTEDAAAAAMPFDAWIKAVEAKNPGIADFSIFKHKVIGRDRIRFMTWPGGPKKLSESDIEGLIGGRITNWKEVGSADLPVKLLLLINGASTTKFLEEKILNGKPVRKDAEVIDSIPKRQKMIASVPGAFGFGNGTMVTAEVNAPEHKVIGRPLTLVWKGQPSKKLTALLEFLNESGSKYVEQE